MKKWMSMIAVPALAFGGYAMVAWASPAVGVTPTLLARGTYEAFFVKSDHDASFRFDAKAKDDVDIVVRQHDYQPFSHTGWHTHPGPVFITVTKGYLTVYEWDDPTCTPRVLGEGQGYLDTGRGHMVRNETGLPAQDVTVIIAGIGEGFRGELPAPNPNCGF